MQDAGAVARAAHARIGDAHHVAHALLQQLLRDRQHAPFRHAGAALRAGIAQHQHVVRRDVEIVVDRSPPSSMDSCRTRAPGRYACRKRGSQALGLMTQPSGARLPLSTASAPSCIDRIVERPDHVVVVDRRRRRCFSPSVRPVTVMRVEMQMLARCGSSAPAGRRHRRSPPSDRSSPLGRILAMTGTLRLVGLEIVEADIARRRGAPGR